MKKSMPILVVVSLIAIPSFTACKAVDYIVKKTPVQIREAKTNFIASVSSETVTVTNQVTNAVTGAVTPQAVVITQLTTNIQPVILPAIWYTNEELTATASSTITTAGNVAGAAGVPFATTAAAGILAITTCVFGFLNRRNKAKALALADGEKEARGALATAKIVGETLVENFESLRKVALTIPAYTPEIDRKVMAGVTTAQALAGVKSEIHDLVEKKTDFTK